jgi:prepilin-type N-terminal cleavage/methylation domain-containing protein
VSTDARQAGFTMIEVLVAMVLLGIGLMSVQAMGVAAARAGALAERNTEYAFAASQRVESILDEVYSGSTTLQCDQIVDDPVLPIRLHQRIVNVDGRVSVVVEASARPGAQRQPQPWRISTEVFMNPGPTCS